MVDVVLQMIRHIHYPLMELWDNTVDEIWNDLITEINDFLNDDDIYWDGTTTYPIWIDDIWN